MLSRAHNEFTTIGFELLKAELNLTIPHGAYEYDVVVVKRSPHQGILIILAILTFTSLQLKLI
jgi:hypothetical protein